jgi:hypothetical protein
MAVTTASDTRRVKIGRWWHWDLAIDDVTGDAVLNCTISDVDPTLPGATPVLLDPLPGESGGVDVTLKNNQQRHFDFIAQGWCNAGTINQNIPVRKSGVGDHAIFDLKAFYTPPS